MADRSLDSPASFRLVAAAAAMVGSLALVALGVQIGTDGLGLDGPDRNPASESASPAAAVVDLPRARAGLDETLLSMLPPAAPGGGTGSASTTSAASPAGPAASSGSTPTAAPTPPSPEPGPGSPPPPTVPVPVPAPEPAPVLPTPDVEPIIAPLAPVLDPIVGDTLDPVTDVLSPDEAPADPVALGLLATLAGLLGL